MTSAAIVLLLVSAALHVAWNYLGKRQHPDAAFFLAANVMGTAAMGVVLIPYHDVVPAISLRIWGLIVATGVFQALYMVGLAGAYRHGHLSVAYPLARALPVFTVALAAFALGRGEQLSNAGMLGMALVVMGTFMLPMAHFRDFRLGNYLNVSCAFAVLAALGTTGYSLIDDEALRQLRDGPDLPTGPVPATMVYGFFEGVSTSLFLAVFVLVRKGARQDLARVCRNNLGITVLTGVIIYATYTLVLIALAFVPDVSYAVAFRQTSIPLGAVVGVLALREPPQLPKFVGVAIMFAGLLLVATG